MNDAKSRSISIYLGFLAVLAFPQGLRAVLHAINFAQRPAYQTTPSAKKGAWD